MIRHEHLASDPYHVQTNKLTIAECCEYIKNHDEYHLEKIRKRTGRRVQKLISTGCKELLS